MQIFVNPQDPMNAEVFAKKDEPIDSILKRFKRAVRKSGALEECKDRQRYSKPSVERHRNKVRRKIICRRMNENKSKD